MSQRWLAYSRSKEFSREADRTAATCSAVGPWAVTFPGMSETITYNEYLQNFLWIKADYNRYLYDVEREYRVSSQNSLLIPICQQINTQ